MVHYDVTIDDGGGLDSSANHEMSPSEARAVAHMVDWLEAQPPDEKVLVFAHHQEMLDAMRDALKVIAMLVTDARTSTFTLPLHPSPLTLTSHSSQSPDHPHLAPSPPPSPSS